MFSKEDLSTEQSFEEIFANFEYGEANKMNPLAIVVGFGSRLHDLSKRGKYEEMPKMIKYLDNERDEHDLLKEYEKEKKKEKELSEKLTALIQEKTKKRKDVKEYLREYQRISSPVENDLCQILKDRQ